MTDRELKKLSRTELIEILIDLSKENEQLRARLADVQQQLADRMIAIEDSGSIAEAALKLNDVFAAAQRACDQYVQNVQARCDRMAAEAQVQIGDDGVQTEVDDTELQAEADNEAQAQADGAERKRKSTLLKITLPNGVSLPQKRKSDKQD